MKQFIQKLAKTFNKSANKTATQLINEESVEAEWFMPGLTRQETEFHLISKKIGAFVIRQSESKVNNYVLSVKVAKFINPTEISHYLVIKTANNTFRLKGFNKEFADLSSLVTHCSVIRDMLPILLDLNHYRQIAQPVYNKEDNYMIYSSSSSSLISFSSVGSFSSNNSCF